jgi:hypothetical protein
MASTKSAQNLAVWALLCWLGERSIMAIPGELIDHAGRWKSIPMSL